MLPRQLAYVCVPTKDLRWLGKVILLERMEDNMKEENIFSNALLIH